MNNKLLLVVLMVLPLVSGIGSVFYAKNFKPEGFEWFLVVCATIPFLNILCAIILLFMIAFEKI